MIRFRAVLPGGYNMRVFWVEIERLMGQEGLMWAGLYARFFDSWEEQPEMQIKTQSGRGKAVVVVSPEADEGLLQIAYWVIHGTEGPYPIEPRGDYPLRFSGTFTPKTMPGVIQSGPGYVGPRDQTAWSVEHPGIEARDTISTIEEAVSAEFHRKMAAATIQALEKARLKPRIVK